MNASDYYQQCRRMVLELTGEQTETLVIEALRAMPKQSIYAVIEHAGAIVDYQVEYPEGSPMLQAPPMAIEIDSREEATPHLDARLDWPSYEAQIEPLPISPPCVRKAAARQWSPEKRTRVRAGLPAAGILILTHVLMLGAGMAIEGARAFAREAAIEARYQPEAL